VSEERGKWKKILISMYGIELGQTPTQTRFQSWWLKDLPQVYGEGEDMLTF